MGLALTLFGISCKLAPGFSAAVCAEGLRDAGAGDGGIADAGVGDGGGAEAGAPEGGAPNGAPGDAGDGGVACPACQPGASCGTVESAAVTSVAGLAASAVHPHVYYLHNGPPDLPRFFAMDQTGADLGTYQVDGVENLDWEDLAVGPCPAGSCVFLADVGDPRQVRGQYAVYRVAEPTTLTRGETSVKADVFPFAYPDGSHDAAAILVHPRTRVVTIVTRDHAGTGTLLYELPSALPGQPVTAVPRGAVDIAQLGLGVAVTAASTREDGQILLRTTKGMALFEAPAGDAGVEPSSTALHGKACAMTKLVEADGESIAWMGSGRGFLTLDRSPRPALEYVFCTGL